MPDLLAAWGVTPVTTRPAAQGTNNTTLLIHARGGDYVLRVSHNLTAIQVAREIAVLDLLERAGLPFAVPRPLPCLDGRRWRPAAGGVATLVPRIEGSRPDLSGPAALAVYGEAVGQLTCALAGIPLQAGPWNWLADEPGPADDVVVTRLRAAGASARTVGALGRLAADVDNETRELRATLPRQVVHDDLAASNLLVGADGRVTGVLDFEVAGAGLRVDEPVAALAQSGALDRADWRDAVAAFARGYATTVRLTDVEVTAVPPLLRLRAVGNVRWRARRWFAGRASLAEVVDRIDGMSRACAWLDDHDAELISLLS